MAARALRVLAIDTASPAPALALLEGQRLETEDLPPAAAEALVSRLAGLFARAGATPSQLDRIAVLSGPGSFTGLRAGIAFARGLARALNVPLVSASTFRAAAAALAAPEPIDVWLDAGRGEVFRARLGREKLEGSVRPLRRSAAAADAAADGVPVRDLGSPPLRLAGALAGLAARDELLPLGTPPVYGRPSAAEERAQERAQEKLAREAAR